MVSLLLSGGPLVWGLLALGNTAIFWGAINLACVRNRTLLTVQALFALLPAAAGAAGAWAAASAFHTLATSAAPKPSELAESFSAGLACGIVGAATTVLAAGLGILALSRHAARWSAPPPAAD